MSVRSRSVRDNEFLMAGPELHELQERYQIIDLLGRGAQGAVYLARDRLRGGRWIALKVLFDGIGGSSESTQLSGFHHPALSRVLDAGLAPFQGNVRSFFTSEYFPGEPITTVTGSDPLRLFEAILRGASEGLAYLHGRRFAHGDLKPAHVLYRTDPPGIRILDLGLCREVGERIRGGTAPYMAPECEPGAALARTHDIYSLGMIMLEFMDRSALRLEAGQTWPEWHRAGTAGKCVERSRSQFPSGFVDLAHACVSVHPGDRPQDAAALIGSLRTDPRLVSTRQRVPFVGRAREVEQLFDWVRNNVSSGNANLAVVGISGVGKSRLLEQLSTLSAERGLQVWNWDGRNTSQSADPHREDTWPSVTAPCLVVIDHLPPERYTDFVAWWKQLARTLRGARPSLIWSLTPEEFSRSPAELTRPFALGARGSEQLGLAPLSEAESETLWQSCGASAAQFAQHGVAAAGRPRELVRIATRLSTGQDSNEFGPAADPRSSLREPSQLVPSQLEPSQLEPSQLEPSQLVRTSQLGEVLLAIPEPVPIVLLKQVGFRSERQVWREIAALDPSPAVRRDADEWQVLPWEGATDLVERAQSSVVLSSTSRSRLGRLAEAWRSRRPETAEFLSAMVASDDGVLDTICQAVKDRGDWNRMVDLLLSLRRVGQHSDRRHWWLREAWLESGRNAMAIHDLSLIDLELEANRIPDAPATTAVPTTESPSTGALASLDRTIVVARILEEAGKTDLSHRLCLRRRQIEQGEGHASNRSIGLHLQGARLALQLGHADSAREWLESCPTLLVSDSENPSALAEALTVSEIQRLATLWAQLGRGEVAVELNRWALDSARKRGRQYSAVILRALSGIAGFERAQGNLNEARHLLELGLRYSRLANRPSESLLLLSNLAGINYERGDLEASQRQYHRAQLELLRAGTWQLIPHVQHGLATVERDRGEYVSSLINERRAARYARRLNVSAVLANAVSSLGELYHLLGAPQLAYESRIEYMRLARKLKNPRLIRRAAASLALAFTRLGCRPLASRWLQQAETSSDGGPRLDAIVAVVRAELTDPSEDDSLSAWADATRLARKSRRSYYRTRGIFGLALAVHRHGRRDRALSLIEYAEGLAESETNPVVTRLRAQVFRCLIENDRHACDGRVSLDHSLSASQLLHLFRRCRRSQLFEESLLVGAVLWRCLPEDSPEQQVLGDLQSLGLVFRRRWSEAARRALVMRWPWPIAWNVPDFVESDRGVDFLPSSQRVSLSEDPVFGDQKRTVPSLSEDQSSAENLSSAESGATSKVSRSVLEQRIRALEEELARTRSQRWSPDASQGIGSLGHELSAAETAWVEASLETAAIETEVRRIEAQRIEAQSSLDPTAVTEATESLPTGRAVWIADSPSIARLEQLCQRYGSTDLAGIVYGESGVGKSAWIERLHAFSERRAGPLRVESCAALPTALLEVELFGYVAGAFTGAERDRSGLLSLVNGGTLALDQIDDLALPLQQSLLRVLDEGRYRPIGGEAPVEFDARIVATLRSPPEEAIANGRLSKDLFYRLQGFELRVPPLREHRADVLPLLQAYLAHFARSFQRSVPRLSEPAAQILGQYAWPGNIRELINCCQRWVVLDRAEVQLDDVSGYSRMAAADLAPELLAPNWREATANFQRQFLLHHLAERNWNQTKTAADLGITRRYLQTLLDRLAIRGWIDRHGAEVDSRPAANPASPQDG